MTVNFEIANGRICSLQTKNVKAHVAVAGKTKVAAQLLDVVVVTASTAAAYIASTATIS